MATPAISNLFTTIATGTTPLAAGSLPVGFPFDGAGGISGTTTAFGYSGTYWTMRPPSFGNYVAGDTFASLFPLNTALDASATTRFIGVIASFNQLVGAATAPPNATSGGHFCMLSGGGTGWKIICVGGHNGVSPFASTDTDFKRFIIDPRSSANVVSESSFDASDITHIGPGVVLGIGRNSMFFEALQYWASLGIIDTQIITAGDAGDPITDAKARDLTVSGGGNSPVAEELNSAFADTIGMIQVGNNDTSYYSAGRTVVSLRGEVTGTDFLVNDMNSNVAGGGRTYDIASGGTLVRSDHIFNAIGKNKFVDEGDVAGSAIGDSLVGSIAVELMNNSISYQGIVISEPLSVVADAPNITGGSIRDWQSLYALEINDTSNVSGMTLSTSSSGKRGILVDVAGNVSLSFDAWSFDPNLEYEIVYTGSGVCSITFSNGTVIDTANKLLATGGGSFDFPSGGSSMTWVGVPSGAEYRVYLDDVTPGVLGTVELQGVESHDGSDVVYNFTSNVGSDVILQVLATGFEEFTQTYTLGSTPQSFNVNLIQELNL